MSTEHTNPPHTWEKMLEMHSTMMDGINEQRKHLQEQQAQLHTLFERQHSKEQQSQLGALLERQLKKEQDLDERLGHFQTQKEQFFEQQTHLQSQIIAQLSAQPRGQSPTDLLGPPAKTGNKLTIKPKEYNGTPEENVVTWLTLLEEAMGNQYSSDEEKISLVASLLSGTAAQWFVNLKLKQERPASWIELKEKMICQFQTVDFQEHLRQQLFQLRQRQSIQEYIQSFRNIVGQIKNMDDLTQVMLFVHGLSSNISIYTRSKHPQTLEEAIREATTFDNFSNGNNNVKFLSNMKTYYDRHIRIDAHPLREGDWVLIHNENRKKFQPHWFGPFKIHKICPLGTFQLEDTKGNLKPDLVHRDMLKRAYFRDEPSRRTS